MASVSIVSEQASYVPTFFFFMVLFAIFVVISVISLVIPVISVISDNRHTEKSLNPAQHFAPNTVLVQFPKELTVVDFIKCL